MIIFLYKGSIMHISFKIIKPNRKTLFLTAICTLIILIIAFIIVISGSSSEKENFFNTNADHVEGIDVSRHNGKIDWEKVANAVDFAIIRVGYRGYGSGIVSEDGNYAENLENANREKIPVGVYFYSQAVTPDEAREEAEFVLERIKPYKVKLPVFIDFEYALDGSKKRTGRLAEADLTGREAAELITAFCDTVKDAGYYAGVYASSSVLNFEIKVSELDDDIYIWAADYNDKVTYFGKYDLWQYTKTGKCDGVNSKYTDRNRWYIP